MTSFIGDYDCKLDAKGRINFPSAFKKQMPPEASESFVVKKDIYENCLVVYTMEEWQRQVELVRARLNPYNPEHNRFLREFHRGEAECPLDASGRMLIPKRLLDAIGADKDLVLAGVDGKIEVWAKEQHERLAMDQQQFASLAQKILGGEN